MSNSSLSNCESIKVAIPLTVSKFFTTTSGSSTSSLNNLLNINGVTTIIRVMAIAAAVVLLGFPPVRAYVKLRKGDQTDFFVIKPNEKGSNLHESKNKHLFGIGLTIGIFLALCLACQGLMTLSQPAINMQKTSLPAAASDSDNSDPIGDEWPMFHGSLNGTGGMNLMPMLKGKLLWNYTTGSAIDSSPAIVGNCLYIGSSDLISTA